MAGLLQLDTIQGAEAEIGATNSRIVRTGTVVNIDATASSDSGVLLGALTADGMPQLGVTLYPGTNLVFVKLRITGFTTNGVFVALLYETPQGIIPSAYIVRDRSSMSSRTATFDPFTKGLLEVSYEGNNDHADPDPGDGSASEGPIPPAPIGKLDRILCPTDVLSPCREISVTRVSVGHPDYSNIGSFGGVNDADWPGETTSALQPGYASQILWSSKPDVGPALPRGYWLFNGVSTEYSRYLNYFTSEISAISMVNIPWSQLLVAKDPATGLYCKPDPTRLAAAITATFNNYHPGLIQFNKDGFGIWGPFPVVNFKPLFGF